jgi:hypothetical protein
MEVPIRIPTEGLNRVLTVVLPQATKTWPSDFPYNEVGTNLSHRESATAPRLSTNDQLNDLVQKSNAAFESLATWG